MCLDIPDKNGKASKIPCNDGLLTNPPPIVGMEVSARWKRTWKGEVIMTIVMPNDVVDTEVYMKTPRGHTGIQVDPWCPALGEEHGVPPTP